jgi:Swi5-dependent recombination DNA repair protein 1
MSTSAAKRRRIDAASQTLSKPFRSPFKTPFKCPLKGASPAQALDASATTSDTRTPTPCEPKSETPTPLAPRNINTLLLNRGTSKLIPATPRPLRVKKPSSSISTAQIYADPEVARLLREQKAWERKLRELNEELDAAEQASKIERESSKWALKCRENGERVDSDEEIDGELMVLIEKWRGASRLAAEELYGNVRDRVNR